VEETRLEGLVETRRERLTSVSWLSTRRAAQRADRPQGSQALLDESAVVSCLAYVDLNPVRAAIAETPEDSDYTSIQRRIRTLQAASEFSGDTENAEQGSASGPPSRTPTT